MNNERFPAQDCRGGYSGLRNDIAIWHGGRDPRAEVKKSVTTMATLKLREEHEGTSLDGIGAEFQIL
jgi:hypothetical protein